MEQARSGHSIPAPYADVKIRILPREEQGYPIEITLGDRQQYPRGHLAPDFLPWVPGVSPTDDGQRLFEWLLADPNFSVAWAEARGGHRRRRIRLRIDEGAPELHTLPWELMRDPTGGTGPEDLAADGDTPFSRYLAVPWMPAEPLAERPVRMLVAISNPDNLTDYPDLAPLDVETERRIAADAVSDLAAGQAALSFLEPPITLPRLEEALVEGCHVLHLVAHGRFAKQAVICLADEQSSVQWTTADEFASLVRRLPQPPLLIFLSSCQTASRDAADAFRGFAPKLVAAGLSAVVAMQDAVPVVSAQAFARTFYRELFRHGMVDLAVNRARSTLLTGEFPGSSIPVLFSRLPDNQLLAQMPDDAAPVIEAKRFEPETIYIPAGPFLMGSPAGPGIPDYETPEHEVILPAYRIGKSPVTNQQYAEFIHKTGRLVPREMGWVGQKPPKEDLDQPVSGVTWYDALEYCQWLSEQTTRSYSLPNEAQWEKAARCCDLASSMREWTCTLWGEKRRAPDPSFAYPWAEDGRNDLSANQLIRRVVRGGVAREDSRRLRCSARQGYAPDDPGAPGSRHGFRVVMAI